MVELRSREASSVGRLCACSSAVNSLVLLAAIVLFAGCGGSEGPQRYRVSGAVTLNGEPIPAGVITFEPDSSKGHTGPQGVATIRNGKFDTNDSGRGVIGGPHLIRIQGASAEGDSGDPQSADPSNPSSVTVLVDNYTTEVELPQADATHDFAITSDELRRSSR